MEIEQENLLEKLLRQAADEPAHRPDFYKVLLGSDIYALGSAGGAGEGEMNLAAGSKVEIVNWEKQDGASVIPFFSSLQVLQKSIETEQSYLMLPAKSLFEMTLGANLFLNPKSLYGKEFLPEEVRQLLSDGVSGKPVTRIVEKETRILIGQPADYPLKMIDSLTKLLSRHGNVKRAFIELMHDTSVDEKPHLIVGIEADGNVELVMSEAGSVARDTAPDGEAVDFFRISGDDTGLSSYFLNESQPFYERK
jgi:hypothetical protein